MKSTAPSVRPRLGHAHNILAPPPMVPPPRPTPTPNGAFHPDPPSKAGAVPSPPEASPPTASPTAGGPTSSGLQPCLGASREPQAPQVSRVCRVAYASPKLSRPACPGLLKCLSRRTPSPGLRPGPSGLDGTSARLLAAGTSSICAPPAVPLNR